MGFNLERLLIDVFNPQKDEKVLVMSDVPPGDTKLDNIWFQRLEMAKEWQETFKNLGKRIGFKVYPLLVYSATGADSAPLPKYGEMNNKKVNIGEILRKTNICVALTQYSATAPLRGFARKFKTLRAASMPGVSKRMEKTALAVDFKVVARKCSILGPKLTKAVSAIVEFSTGHQIRLDLRNRMAVEGNGICHRTKAADHPVINLPSGEVFTAPYEGEDGKLGPSRTEGLLPVKYGKELVIYRVRRNKIVEVIGKGPKAKKERIYFALDLGRRNIAELGLGVNDKAVVSGVVLEDEKAGFHWAYGLSDHLGGKTGIADFENPKNAVHHDTVYAKGSPIEVEMLILYYPDSIQERIIQNGEYVIF